MKISKWKIIFYLSCVALLMLIATVGLLLICYKPISKTYQSCLIYNEFSNALENKNWVKAKEILKTDPSWCKIENGKLLYWGHSDIKNNITVFGPSYLKTLEYYITDGSMGDKVVFVNGYILLKDGKITFIKIP